MAVANASPWIRISANAPVFDLPILVALEANAFEAAGLHVSYHVGPAEDSPVDPLTRLKERQFEARGADAYNLCAWGGLDRLERSGRGGRIAALRPAIVAQAIVSFDDTLQNPHDLADVEVGINAFTASHYTVLQLLSGSLPREHLKVVHVGGPGERYQALKTGRLRAVALMEPDLSLALKEGAHLIAMTFYRGAEVIASELPDDVIDAYFDVLNDAVDAINADFDRHRHHIVSSLDGRLASRDLGRQFLRYAHAETYDEDATSKIHPWMESWGLSHAASRPAPIRLPQLAAA